MPPDFQIAVNSGLASHEDWREAQAAPLATLPPLDEREERAAAATKLPRDHFQRTKLMLELGRRRMEERARHLGGFAAQVLHDAQARVTRVAWQSDRRRWLLTVERGGREYGIPVALETFTEALESKILRAESQLRGEIRSGVGLPPEEAH